MPTVDFNRYAENIEMGPALDWYERARAKVFGISAGWLTEEERDKLASISVSIDYENQIYQIVCVECGNAFRRMFSKTEIEKFKGGREGIESFCHDQFDQEASCHHFEQFQHFYESVKAGSQYSKDLDAQIQTHARLMEIGRS